MATISSFTWTLYKTCKRNAPELSREVNELRAAIQEFEEETNGPQTSFLSRLSPPLKDEYRRLVGECVTDLQELSQLIQCRKQCLRQNDIAGAENAMSSLTALRPRLLEHAASFTSLQEAIENVDAEGQGGSFSPVQEPASPEPQPIPIRSLSRASRKELRRSKTHQAYVESVIDSDDDIFLTTPTDEAFEPEIMTPDEPTPYDQPPEPPPEPPSPLVQEVYDPIETVQHVPGSFPESDAHPAPPKERTRSVRRRKQPPLEIHQDMAPSPVVRALERAAPVRLARIHTAAGTSNRRPGVYYRYSEQTVPQRPVLRRAPETAPVRAEDSSSRWSSAATCGRFRAETPVQERPQVNRQRSAMRNIKRSEKSTEELKEEIQREEAAKRNNQRRVRFEDENRYSYSPPNPFRITTPQQPWQAYQETPNMALQQQQSAYAVPPYNNLAMYNSAPYSYQTYANPQYPTTGTVQLPGGNQFGGFPFPPASGYFNHPQAALPPPQTPWYAFSPPPAYNGPFSPPVQAQAPVPQHYAYQPAEAAVQTHPPVPVPVSQQPAPVAVQPAAASAPTVPSAPAAAAAAPSAAAGTVAEGQKPARRPVEEYLRYFVVEPSGCVHIKYRRRSGARSP
ncbi:uncharacterized protein K452DRAFT_357493 [Aplosporella prunicola CBS 121167]|uniref:Uncharacterized protein n=1 Tax=Aplosporella prunicola CBS 121167 TaxID=1176127 RepID=A0A6A6BIR8_9PEZI|nr:uncharacterized protein K452DRAFT_357493 [Aplosporella prunicola CBS 121167]KAF2143906.1 hypothetical protein K452DRAFT_357493 [Aplosporella prunicola CBS 121167]